MSSSELYLISKVIQQKDIQPAVRAGLKPDHLTGEWAGVWSWILDYQRAHGSTPTERVFMQEYGGVTLYDATDEPFSRLLDEIFDAYKKR